MTSVFTGVDNQKEQVALADTIVTAVFMGLVRERLVSGYQVFIGYGGGFDPYEGSQNPGQGKRVSDEDENLHKYLETLLQEKFPAYASKLVIGAANKWMDASKGKREHVTTSNYVITGAPSQKQIHKEMSVAARRLAIDCLNSNRYKDAVSKERGAYYGVADLDNGEIYGPIATTRHVYWERSGRWLNPSHGWIMAGNVVAPGSNAKMDDTDDEKLIAAGLTTVEDVPYVIGYCHGMIFAEHICKVSGGGTAYEISMNEQTCKNASCFGCCTFMFANGMPPSWMHIGSAESWAPLPEKAGNFSYRAHFNHNRIEEVAKSMNKTWADAVARWMKSGVNYTTRSSKTSLVKERLLGASNREAAYWFLDALTFHGRGDIERIINVLAP
jgi:hypothetical protein